MSTIIETHSWEPEPCGRLLGRNGVLKSHTPGGVPTNSRYGPSPFITSIRSSLEAVLHRESGAVPEAIALTRLALRPMEARVTAEADDVLGSDLFDLLLPYTRPDPLEPCFRSALSACAHGSPSLHDSTGLVEEFRAAR